MLGQLDRIGTLAVGKQADLVLIRADDLNMLPVHDPVSTILMQTTLANIDSVMVAGHWRKRHGRLLEPDLQSKLELLISSGRKITAALGLNTATH
jgi:cytosine/adenosine deaminase-related metal-dependent hydrolase